MYLYRVQALCAGIVFCLDLLVRTRGGAAKDAPPYPGQLSRGRHSDYLV